MQEVDNEFYERADAQIHLSNDQINERATFGTVSASNMYATARFNAWCSACGWNNGKEMAASKQETLDYFVAEYRKMLEENLDDYIDNFESYMRSGKRHPTSEAKSRRKAETIWPVCLDELDLLVLLKSTFMNPSKVSRNKLSSLTDLPNIGKAGECDLKILGIFDPKDLIGKCPYQMYESLCLKTQVLHDPCVIDVFISITRFMNGEDAKPWWAYTEERKEKRTKNRASFGA